MVFVEIVLLLEEASISIPKIAVSVRVFEFMRLLLVLKRRMPKWKDFILNLWVVRLFLLLNFIPTVFGVAIVPVMVKFAPSMVMLSLSITIPSPVLVMLSVSV